MILVVCYLVPPLDNLFPTLYRPIGYIPLQSMPTWTFSRGGECERTRSPFWVFYLSHLKAPKEGTCLLTKVPA